MISFNDLLSALKLWPKWKRIEAAVERVDNLETRVLELESRLARCPGEACPKCGELSFRAVRSGPDYPFLGGRRGSLIRHMKCEKCGFEEDHTVNP
jgi:C4-type Zn-finger protein